MASCLLSFVSTHLFFSFEVVERAAQSSASRVCSLAILRRGHGAIFLLRLEVRRHLPGTEILTCFQRYTLGELDTNRSSPVAVLTNDYETSQAICTFPGYTEAALTIRCLSIYVPSYRDLHTFC